MEHLFFLFQQQNPSGSCTCEPEGFYLSAGKLCQRQQRISSPNSQCYGAIQHKAIPGSDHFLMNFPEETGEAPQALPCAKFFARLSQKPPAAIGLRVIIGGFGNIHLMGIPGGRAIQGTPAPPEWTTDPPDMPFDLPPCSRSVPRAQSEQTECQWPQQFRWSPVMETEATRQETLMARHIRRDSSNTFGSASAG